MKLNRDGPPDLAVVVILPAFPRPTEPPFDCPYLMNDSLLVLSLSYFASFYCAIYSLW